MPPAESRVKMNGFAAPDTAAVICSAAIKRGFAAPSPGFPAHNFIFSESNLRKILDSTSKEEAEAKAEEKIAEGNVCWGDFEITDSTAEEVRKEKARDVGDR